VNYTKCLTTSPKSSVETQITSRHQKSKKHWESTSNHIVSMYNSQMELLGSLPQWEDRNLLSHTHRHSKNLKLPRNLLSLMEKMMSMELKNRKRFMKNLRQRRFSKYSTLKSSFIMILSGRSNSHSILSPLRLKLKKRMLIGRPNIFNLTWLSCAIK